MFTAALRTMPAGVMMLAVSSTSHTSRTAFGGVFEAGEAIAASAHVVAMQWVTIINVFII
jgi:hypothetical protein